MRRIVTALAVLLGLIVFPLAAEELLSANDLGPEQITAPKDFGAFKIFARSDKGVTIEGMDVAREASDGEVFNSRIKLNGGGAADYRSIQFSTKGKAEVTIYTNSSSKTDTRALVLINVADGSVIAELPAPPDDGAKAGIAKATVPAAGTYAVYSKASGINIYQIVVK